jgi:lysyl-tRNA synthetase, class II
VNFNLEVIGGFDRVYEIGKVFRNEGIGKIIHLMTLDPTHNPEFTSCEFYQAYSDYEELMTLTEDYISSLVKLISGGLKLKIGENEIDFTPPFKRLSYLGSIEDHLKLKLPKESDKGKCSLVFILEDSIEILLKICQQHHIKIDEKRISYAYLLDKLSGSFVEPNLIQPTFLIDHPLQLSPLAKNHSNVILPSFKNKEFFHL